MVNLFVGEGPAPLREFRSNRPCRFAPGRSTSASDVTTLPLACSCCLLRQNQGNPETVALTAVRWHAPAAVRRPADCVEVAPAAAPQNPEDALVGPRRV